jgi:hypothetical protein
MPTPQAQQDALNLYNTRYQEKFGNQRFFVPTGYDVMADGKFDFGNGLEIKKPKVSVTLPSVWKVENDMLIANKPVFSENDADLERDWNDFVAPHLGKERNGRRTYVYELSAVPPTGVKSTLKCKPCNGSGGVGQNDPIELYNGELYKFGITDITFQRKVLAFEPRMAARYGSGNDFGVIYNSKKNTNLNNVSATNKLGANTNNSLPRSLAEALESLLIINYQIESRYTKTGGNNSLKAPPRNINTTNGLSPGNSPHNNKPRGY